MCYQVRVGEEHQARATVDHLSNGGLLDVSHVAEDGEHEDTSNETGEGVDNAGNDGISKIRHNLN